MEQFEELEQVHAGAFQWTDVLANMLESNKCGDCVFHTYAMSHHHTKPLYCFVFYPQFESEVPSRTHGSNAAVTLIPDHIIS